MFQDVRFAIRRLLSRPGSTLLTLATLAIGIGAEPPSGDPLVVPMNSVSPDFFETLHVPLVAGRTFQDGDTSASVIVSRAMAERVWPEGGTIGRRFRMFAKDEWKTVIGIAADVEGRVGDSATRLALYYPLVAPATAPAAVAPQGPPSRRTYSSRTLVVRAGTPETVIPMIKDAIWTIDSR